MTVCDECYHFASWHHANQLLKDEEGNKYIRTCYGIGCRCGARFGFK